MRDLQLPGRSPVMATRAMAATSHPLASSAAIEILRAGGNALDGAIAAAAVQGVVEPGSTGIGGDCFCQYVPRGRGTPIAFNGSGRAPAAATAAEFAACGINHIEQHSPHAVTVPGAVDAWVQLNAQHGRLPLGEVLAPAVHHAREGFAVSSRVGTDWTRCIELLQRDPNAAAAYLLDGRSPAVGAVHRFPALADTLEAIGREGRDAFYGGDRAAAMVEHLRALGGLHTLADFAAARGDFVTPIHADYLGWRVHQCPPNGQGLIALILLNVLAGLHTDKGPLDAARVHTELEACRLAYRARDAYIADPSQAEVPVEQLLGAGYAAQLRAAIDPARATEPPLAWPLTEHADTVYISVVDEERNCCSFINTLFHGFGSGIVAPDTGILLHNRGQGFSLDPAHPNAIAPRKRPLHTIIPGMATADDKVQLCYGVMGGHYQAFGHLQFLSRVREFGCDLQEAMDLPRWMVDPMSGDVEMEWPAGEALMAAMRDLGHRVAVPAAPIGGSQAIGIDWESGVLTGASDPRKDGCAVGY